MLNEKVPDNNRKRLAAIVASLVMLGVAGTVTTLNYFRPVHVPPAPVHPSYFMDLKTGELFAAANQLPPIDGPSGAKDAQGNGTGVLALVYSCGDCADESGRLVTLLVSTDPAHVDPQTKATLTADVTAGKLSPRSGGGMGVPAPNGVIVASPDARDHWVSVTDPEALQLAGAAMPRCNGAGESRRPCFPPVP